MSNIDIVVAIDEKAIVDNNQYSNNVNKAALVDSKYIHVMTYDGNSVVDNFGNELRLLSIRSGDNIRWRGSSLSPVDVPYSAILNSFVPDDLVLYGQYIDRTTRKIQINKMPVADVYGGVEMMDVSNNYWLNVVIKNAPPSPQSVRLSYTGNFTIYNADKVVGYCQWKHTLVLSG
ncbi:AidA/PixA family protein [Xenorhabdus bovienii]|uniref:AidA/PixA family protein n=1 Tax=Xenorhabdus bovienii TaxID=40576 RepID=UPI00237C6649|nr:AidA/PixA family protein [Xenorhabdus bovienii]MDE1474096.1 inclusion body family protein [Xenorhabdus bovienii]MDE9457513.1 inclusion body family protein [Xenorhabdus bovienii]MDE9487643.1 inclusion body family protein [Xenorhabdus bovienii]MDE9514391.1 inclusion body family protein [Xenorhabdus bovienii]